MKLQARNFVVRKPETIDITMFFKKFCIATRTRKALVFGQGLFSIPISLEFLKMVELRPGYIIIEQDFEDKVRGFCKTCTMPRCCAAFFAAQIYEMECE